MKKIMVWILTLILAVSLLSPALGESVFAGGDAAWSGWTKDENRGPVVLKRGKTRDAWIACNYNTVIDADPDKTDYAVTYYTLKGIGKNPSVTVSSGTSWLSAEIKSKKLYLTVTGKNDSQSTKAAVVTVKDNKGVFATLHVYRAGADKITAIQQVGKTIHLKIKYAKAAQDRFSYLKLTIFDNNGNVIEENYPTNQKPLRGATEYVYNLTKLKKGYTYAFAVGYASPYMSYSNCSWAAAIRLKSASGNQKGKIKNCYGHDFDNAFLFDIAK